MVRLFKRPRSLSLVGDEQVESEEERRGGEAHRVRRQGDAGQELVRDVCGYKNKKIGIVGH